MDEAPIRSYVYLSDLTRVSYEMVNGVGTYVSRPARMRREPGPGEIVVDVTHLAYPTDMGEPDADKPE